jgi:hypothetical protein
MSSVMFAGNVGESFGAARVSSEVRSGCSVPVRRRTPRQHGEVRVPPAAPLGAREGVPTGGHGRQRGKQRVFLKTLDSFGLTQVRCRGCS